jgi:hypothetical protein
MPLAGFKPTATAFKRVKTVHALNRAAALVGKVIIGRLITCNGVQRHTKIHTTNIYGEFDSEMTMYGGSNLHGRRHSVNTTLY